MCLVKLKTLVLNEILTKIKIVRVNRLTKTFVNFTVRKRNSCVPIVIRKKINK